MAVHGDVADLAAGTVGAINDLAVDDDTAAHAGAQRDHDRAAAALGGTHPDLAQSGHVGIVAHQNLDAAQHTAKLFSHIVFAPAAEVCTDDGHDAAVQNRAGHAHAHALYLLSGKAFFLHLALHGSGQIFQNVLTGVGGVGGNFPLFQQFAGGLEQADLGGGAAQIDAECVFLHSSFTPSAARGRIFHSYSQYSTPAPKRAVPLRIFMQTDGKHSGYLAQMPVLTARCWSGCQCRRSRSAPCRRASETAAGPCPCPRLPGCRWQ